MLGLKPFILHQQALKSRLRQSPMPRTALTSLRPSTTVTHHQPGQKTAARDPKNQRLIRVRTKYLGGICHHATSRRNTVETFDGQRTGTTKQPLHFAIESLPPSKSADQGDNSDCRKC